MARATWSYTMSFGLASVAVKMFSATESKELCVHFLHRPTRKKGARKAS